MQLVLKSSGKKFHVEPGVGLALIEISNGKIEEYKEPVPKRATTRWSVEVGAKTGQPFVLGICGPIVMRFPEKKQRPILGHDVCPQEIFEQFKKLAANWSPFEPKYSEADRERMIAEDLINKTDTHFIPVVQR